MIFIGLQNAEKKYEKTRHNAGAIVLNYLANKEDLKKNNFKLDKYTNSYKAEINEGSLFLPNTFMNLSGESVSKIYNQEKKNSDNFSVKDIFVFVDDVTIPVGEFKISVGEGASSHNGIKSIIENLQGVSKESNDFTRVRIGVGKMIKDENGKEKLFLPGPEKLADFVLGNLNNLEIVQIQSLGQEIIYSLSRPK